MKRYQANKSKSARQFKGNLKRTKAPNLAPPPMRGGYRL
ncbi:MAG: hypothetical protein [Microvirus sp.]|nr:MAG: hypothetical protein [Microvirus sp.]